MHADMRLQAGVVGGVLAVLLLATLAAAAGVRRHTGLWPLQPKPKAGKATIAAPIVEPSLDSQPQLPELVPDREINAAHMLQLRGESQADDVITGMG